MVQLVGYRCLYYTCVWWMEVWFVFCFNAFIFFHLFGFIFLQWVETPVEVLLYLHMSTRKWGLPTCLKHLIHWLTQRSQNQFKCDIFDNFVKTKNCKPNLQKLITYSACILVLLGFPCFAGRLTAELSVVHRTRNTNTSVQRHRQTAVRPATLWHFQKMSHSPLFSNLRYCKAWNGSKI